MNEINNTMNGIDTIEESIESTKEVANATTVIPTVIHTMENIVADPEGVYEDLKIGHCNLREPLIILLAQQLKENKIEIDQPELLKHPSLKLLIIKNETELEFKYVEKKRSKDKDRYYMPVLALGNQAEETLKLVIKFYGAKLLLDRLQATLMRDYQSFWGTSCESNKSDGPDKAKSIEAFRKAVEVHGAKAIDEEAALLRSIKGMKTDKEKRAALMKLVASYGLGDEDDDSDGEAISLDDLDNTEI